MTTAPGRRYLPILAGIASIGWLLLVQVPQARAEPLAFVPGEQSPGGKATSRRRASNANAFSHASGNISFEREFDFKIGNGIFKKLWGVGTGLDKLLRWPWPCVQCAWPASAAI